MNRVSTQARAAWIVIACTTLACGGSVPTSGATPGAKIFVVVPRRQALDRSEGVSFHQDTQGRMVDADGEPDLAFCKAKCAAAVPPERTLLGCRDTRATPDVQKSFAIDESFFSGRHFLVCEIR